MSKLSSVFAPAAALLAAACAAAPPPGSGVLEIAVDASAWGRGGNIPRVASAPRESPSPAGWRLEVVRADGGTVASIISDDHGLARVTLPAGDYRVRPSGPAGEAANQAVAVPAGGTVRIVVHPHNNMP